METVLVGTKSYTIGGKIAQLTAPKTGREQHRNSVIRALAALLVQQ